MTNAILTRDTFEIYRIRNIQNNKSYIGCTTIGFKNRVKQHIALSTKDSPCYIHRAIAKYGVESFEYQVIDSASSLEELKKLEIDLIKRNKTISPHGYNMTNGGDGGFGLIPEIRIKIGLAKKGRKHTQEHKDKKAMIDRLVIQNKQTAQKNSDALKKKWQDPEFRTMMMTARFKAKTT